MIYHHQLYKQSIHRLARLVPVNDCKILITGASGLIGSCLIDVFIDANQTFGKNIEVYALSRNIDRLYDRYDVTNHIYLISQNIVEPIELDDIDYIIHAASNADPKSYAKFPSETILTNILGTKNVLDYCKGHKSRALFTSTFEVYGNLNKDAYNEEDFGIIDLNLIRSCYPESKRTAEMLVKAYHDEYNVDCVIARLSSVYGPTMLSTDSKAHAQFLRNALAGDNIVLKSQGTQKRSYTYVMDSISGILSVLFKGKTGEAYNIASDKSVATIAEVAHLIAELVGTNVIYDLPDEIESKGFSRPQNCVLITDKIKNLGWSGEYDLRQGLFETLSILREK